VGTIDSIEKNKATVNYGTQWQKLTTEQEVMQTLHR
jgi:hypothetical protein